jgi:hypothetical protein
MSSNPSVRLSCLHPHAAANEAVTLLKGPVTIPANDGDLQGTGALALHWLPTTGLRLDADLESGWNGPHPGNLIRINIAGNDAETLVSSTNVGVNEGATFSTLSGRVRTFVKGSGNDLAHLGFQVVNFSAFLTPGPHQSPQFGNPPMVAELAWNGWRIRLSAVDGAEQIFKTLKETGGYAFTHVGRLDRTDGSPFNAQDADKVLGAVNRFLGFARGAASNLAVRWGVDASETLVFEQWVSPVVDPWKGGDNWFDEHHGNLLSEIFPAFATAHADPDTWEALSLALHWYRKANMRDGGMEGAIILGLTSLDLLGAMIVVDKTSSISASKYDNLPHGEKLRALLGVLQVAPVFPARSAELATFAATQNWTDTAQALAEIRHGYVHANRKRRRVVLSATNLATFWAWQLSLWYQEMALLFLLDHRGQYRNRMTAGWLGEVETVPWA